MRFLLTLLIAVASLSAIAQEKLNTYGKTDAQVLAMGMEKWMNFYTEKAGSSTADMTWSAEIYARIATRRNDRLLQQQLDGDFKMKVVKLRKLLGDFGASAVDVQYCKAGGGTMYNIFWSVVPGEVEDVLYPILTATGSKPKAMVVSSVTKELAKVRAGVEAAHRAEKNNEFFKYGDAKDAATKMTKLYGQIVAIAKTMSRRDSDRLLGFCLERARNASE